MTHRHGYEFVDDRNVPARTGTAEDRRRRAEERAAREQAAARVVRRAGLGDDTAKVLEMLGLE